MWCLSAALSFVIWFISACLYCWLPIAGLDLSLSVLIHFFCVQCIFFSLFEFTSIWFAVYDILFCSAKHVCSIVTSIVSKLSKPDQAIGYLRMRTCRPTLLSLSACIYYIFYTERKKINKWSLCIHWTSRLSSILQTFNWEPNSAVVHRSPYCIQPHAHGSAGVLVLSRYMAIGAR